MLLQMRHPETPVMRDACIHKHLNQAREYWRKIPAGIAEDNFRQANKNGWNAVAQLTKAVATLRGWEHYDPDDGGWEHCGPDDIRDAIRDLAYEMPSESQMVAVFRGLGSAEHLYGRFYEVSRDPLMTKGALNDLRPLLEILWQQLPAQYTGGLPSFAAFCQPQPEPQREPEPEPPPTPAG